MKSDSSLTMKDAVGDRAEALFREQREEVYRETDQFLARLLLLEWVALIVVAFFVTPGDWRTQVGRIEWHVWKVIALGGTITLIPLALVRMRPGAALTRYTLAIAQMLHSGLFIGLNGDRPEMHSHVFCSLVVLSFYRDWRVLVPATLVVGLEHFLPGASWPLRMHGAIDGGWPSLEHCAWVLLADIFLALACLRRTNSLRASANHTAALEASRQTNQLIMDSSRDVICTNDAAGRFVTVSAACEALWGYKPEELIGKSCQEMVHPDDRERTRLANLEVMAGRPANSFENRYRRKDGTLVDVLWSAYWSGSDGTMFQVARDITGRKKAEIALQQTNRQLQSALQAIQLIMDNSQDVICSLDKQGRFLTTNAACRDLWGYEPSELIGRCYLVLVHPEDRAWSKEAEEGARARGKRSDFVNRCLRKDASMVNVLWSASWSATDEILVCVAHDVTEQQRVEKALREAKEEADRANRAKSEFLSRMSHELRTPLNAILGFGQLLERQNPRPNQMEHVGHILTGGRHLLKLINEVLDISRIEADRIHLSVESVSLSVALQEATDLIRPLAIEHSVNLFTLPEDETASFVRADHQRLKQVLLNILNNAVKYTPAGGSVTIECEADEENIRLAIRDTGIGIAADKIERVFTPFDRLGAEQSGVEGLGLGLALSRRLMQAMGGRIGVESVIGEGSLFWIELKRTASPLQSLPNKKMAARRPIPHPIKRRSVLYIEDNLSNLTLIQQLLGEEEGFELLTAMQGRIGLDLARQHAPDLILLDLHLPDMPGAEVLAALQANETTRRIPTIVVSADATAGQLQRLLAGGARGYITKPIDVGRFYRVMEKTVSRSDNCVAA
jgi:PAS domain S-box-containing protein